MGNLSGAEIVAGIKRPLTATLIGTATAAAATGFVATITLANTLKAGDIVRLAGFTPADYNGDFYVQSATSANFTIGLLKSGIAVGTVLGTVNKLTGAWSTAAACGILDGILILPTSMSRSADVDIDDSLGMFFSTDGTPGPVKVEGAVPAYLRYDGMSQAMISHVMGNSDAPQLLSTSLAFKHVLKFTNTVDGLFYTFAKNMINYVEEYPSAKISGFTIKADVGAPVEISYDIIACAKIPDSTVNTLSTITAVTYFSTANRVRMSEGVFRINVQSGADFTSNDIVYPSGFELTVKRKLTGVHTGQYAEQTGEAKQAWIDEPANDGVPEITLKLQFPRHTSNTRVLALSNDTRYKMDITFNGALIEGSIYRQMKFQFPHLQLKSVDIADDRGNIKEPVEFIIHKAVTAPTGMTGITDPFWLTIQNRRGKDLRL